MMKSLLSTSLALLLAAAPSTQSGTGGNGRDVGVGRRNAPAPARQGLRIALVVGIDDYVYLDDLRYANKDAKDMEEALRAADFDAVAAMRLDTRDSPHHAATILSKVVELCSVVGPHDTLLVFLSGHGFNAENGDPFYCAHYTDPERLEVTGLSLMEVRRVLQASLAGRKLLVVDACRDPGIRSAATPELRVAEDFAMAGLGWLSSTSPGTVSYEPFEGLRDEQDRSIQNGIFTHFLLRGLEGDADQDRDGQVTFREWGEHAFRATVRQTKLKQRPELRWIGDPGADGEVVMRTLPRTEPEPAPAPVPQPAPPPTIAAPKGCRVAPGAQLLAGVWSAVVHEATGQKFLYVPPGAFQMGSPEGEEGREDDETQHRRRITRGFYLAETEVTVGQFEAFVAAAKYQTDAERGVKLGEYERGSWVFGKDGKWAWRSEANWRNAFPIWEEYRKDANHPVVHVSWNDAQAYCRHYGLRLPSEAEWEYAARAGTTTAFPWGGKAEDGLGRLNAFDGAAGRLMGWESHTGFSFDDGHALLAPVGVTAPNAWGFRDMIGNVWEWCADAYGDYPTSGADQSAASGGSMRVIRGGSWSYAPRGCRSAGRDGGVPALRFGGLGFRPALP